MSANGKAVAGNIGAAVAGKVVFGSHDIHHSKRLIKPNDIEYKAAPGEILAKDSILYSRTPALRLLRRQLWPIVEDTMNTLTNGVTVGANLFKQMVRTAKPDPSSFFQNMKKMKSIKNVYLTGRPPFMPAPTKVSQKQQIAKKGKKPIPLVVIKDGPMNTVSEDYTLTYGSQPSYALKSVSKKPNPYGDMGVTGYKHFEATVLRELEEKEERKAEATMLKQFQKAQEQSNAQTLKLQDFPDADLIKGIPYGGWTPIRPESQAIELPTTQKPHTMSHLHTDSAIFSDNVRPIHESVEESKKSQINVESTGEKPIISHGFTSAQAFKPIRTSKLNSRKTFTTTTTSSPLPKDHTIQDAPNYPDHFLKKNKHLMTEQQPKDIDASRSAIHNYMQRQKYHRELKKHVLEMTGDSARPATVHLDMETSQSQSSPGVVVDTPLTNQKTKRLKANRAEHKEQQSTSRLVGGTRLRGSIKFGSSQYQQ